MPLIIGFGGIPAVLSTGIPGNALRAFPGPFRNSSGISSGKSQPYWGCGPETPPFEIITLSANSPASIFAKEFFSREFFGLVLSRVSAPPPIKFTPKIEAVDIPPTPRCFGNNRFSRRFSAYRRNQKMGIQSMLNLTHIGQNFINILFKVWLKLTKRRLKLAGRGGFHSTVTQRPSLNGAPLC